MTNEELKSMVETAVEIQKKEVFGNAKFHPEVREDYRMTNDWYGADTIARDTAIVRFNAPEGDGMDLRRSVLEAFGLFYRKYASPMYTISVDTVILKSGAVGVMLHACFHDDVHLSDEDLAVVQECNMAHRFAGEDVPVADETVPDAPVPVEPEEQRKRYSGDAMIKDDICRHSKYDLKGVDFSIPLVEWVDKVNGHDVWRAFVEFLIEGKLTESSFKFSEAGSAIDNSVNAVDYMVSCLPQLGLRFKEEK